MLCPAPERLFAVFNESVTTYTILVSRIIVENELLGRNPLTRPPG